jgi:hypothetical protein
VYVNEILLELATDSNIGEEKGEIKPRRLRFGACGVSFLGGCSFDENPAPFVSGSTGRTQ